MTTTNFPKVNYIGNKKKLVDWIGSNIPISEGIILDLFAGSGSVSYHLKQKGYTVITNEALYASYVINKALIENKFDKLDKEEIRKVKNQEIDKPTRDSLKWMDEKLFYSHEVDELSKFVKHSNELDGYDQFILKALIRRSMIRKLPYSRMNVNWNNIVKLRDEEYSYKKYGRRRAYHNESFEYHILDNIDEYNDAVFNNGKNNKSLHLDYIEALETTKKVDVIYLDPPYPGTMNKYYNFYGSFDKMFDKNIETTDLTKIDDFLDKIREILLLSKNKTRYIVLSLNSNTQPSYKDIANLMAQYGEVRIEKRKHNYQLSGKKEKNSNLEILIILEFPIGGKFNVQNKESIRNAKI